MHELLSGDGDLSAKMEHLAVLAREHPVAFAEVALGEAETGRKLRSVIESLEEHRLALGAELRRLTAAPLFPATFLSARPTEEGVEALVRHAGTKRVVTVSDSADITSLHKGDEVLLGANLNTIVRRSMFESPHGTETVTFERSLGDGRIVVRARDEEHLAERAASLQKMRLCKGDRLSWDRSSALAYEVLPKDRAADEALFDELPPVGFDAIGGLDRQIDELLEPMRLSYEHPELARLYRQEPVRGILLHGPPGGGKTMLARALAGWTAERSTSTRSRLLYQKPGANSSMWYGETERIWRDRFRAVREMAEREPDTPVIFFLDEADSLGVARGSGGSAIDDRIQTSIFAELDALQRVHGVIVIAATNRKHALDPALLRPERLASLEIEIPRPNMPAARAIFDKHLPQSAPYAHAHPEADPASSRAELIEAAVALLYAPGSPVSELGTLRGRDGRAHPLCARDVMSGAVIANICRRALRKACSRAAWAKGSGPSGLSLIDLEEAIRAELATQAGHLTPTNVRQHLSNLPAELDVIRVELAAAKRKASQHYLRVA
jgi:proteasome ATPase